MVRRGSVVIDDEEIDDGKVHVDERLEQAWQSYWQAPGGTRQRAEAFARYKRLLLGLPDEQERDTVPRFDVSVPLPHYMNRHLLVYLDGLNRPWRLTVVADPNNPKYGYYATENEARRVAKYLGIDV